MSDDEMAEHMQTAHCYPEPSLWSKKNLAEIHRLEHELLDRGVFDFEHGMEVHAHA